MKRNISTLALVAGAVAAVGTVVVSALNARVREHVELINPDETEQSRRQAAEKILLRKQAEIVREKVAAARPSASGPVAAKKVPLPEPGRPAPEETKVVTAAHMVPAQTPSIEGAEDQSGLPQDETPAAEPRMDEESDEDQTAVAGPEASDEPSIAGQPDDVTHKETASQTAGAEPEAVKHEEAASRPAAEPEAVKHEEAASRPAVEPEAVKHEEAASRPAVEPEAVKHEEAASRPADVEPSKPAEQPAAAPEESSAQYEDKVVKNNDVDEIVAQIMATIDKPAASETDDASRIDAVIAKTMEQERETAKPAVDYATAYPKLSRTMIASIIKQMAATMKTAGGAASIVLQHYLSFPDADQAVRYAVHAKRQGFMVEPRSNPKELLVIRTVVNRQEELEQEALGLAADAVANGGKYRGWGIRE